MARKAAVALMVCTLSGAAMAEDYLGTLRAPQSSLAPAGIYSFATIPSLHGATGESGMRFKLGYKYSRFFAIEGEVSELARAGAAEPFAQPTNLASAFRTSGFGVDTIAMLPVWRFSFYGRLGAYRGDARNGFGFGSTALLPSEQYSRGMRLRYGLGMRYDFTKSLGVRAELERNSPFSSPFAADVDAADQVSVGVTWRF
jgi:hypothetical protein